VGQVCLASFNEADPRPAITLTRASRGQALRVGTVFFQHYIRHPDPQAFSGLLTLLPVPEDPLKTAQSQLNPTIAPVGPARRRVVYFTQRRWAGGSQPADRARNPLGPRDAGWRRIPCFAGRYPGTGNTRPGCGCAADVARCLVSRLFPKTLVKPFRILQKTSPSSLGWGMLTFLRVVVFAKKNWNDFRRVRLSELPQTHQRPQVPLVPLASHSFFPSP